ncbi:MAG: DNA/RNA nuclease SfsA [Ruminococcaceae bacterium]|nr:DNA/RNA nuclease SfsA [Oscillospiraceae bacterium]
MRYPNTVIAEFLSRPNRFIARVRMGDTQHTVHVKNTGRCRELLVPGRQVVLARGGGEKRKTEYDLIAVDKPGLGWVNIDSQAPNTVAREWLGTLAPDLLRPEYTFGDSRLDFYMEKGGERYLIEVKGCTLEIDGQGYFPDAPTVRGAKHLRELNRAFGQGYTCAVLFVIQMNGITAVHPNRTTDPAFAAAWAEAEAAGVRIIPLPCTVTEDTLTAADNGTAARALLGE